MTHMLADLKKSFTRIITSALGLAVGAGAFVLNKSASAGATSTGGGILPILPPTPPHHGPVPVPVVPEVNTGSVLLPVVLAILLFASLHLLRQRGEKTHRQSLRSRA
jgi:hypothetical protein